MLLPIQLLNLKQGELTRKEEYPQLAGQGMKIVQASTQQ